MFGNSVKIAAVKRRGCVTQESKSQLCPRAKSSFILLGIVNFIPFSTPSRDQRGACGAGHMKGQLRGTSTFPPRAIDLLRILESLRVIDLPAESLFDCYQFFLKSLT